MLDHFIIFNGETIDRDDQRSLHLFKLLLKSF